MAMKENKSVQVDPSRREEVVTTFNSFGWELRTENEVKTNENRVLDSRDDEYDYYKIIPGEHYIRLGFERDTGRQNYSELKDLEQQYYSVNTPTIWEAPRFITKLWVILIVVGLLFYVVPGIILLVVHIIKFKKDTELWNSRYEKYKVELAAAEKEQADILAKAQALV